MKRNKYKVVPAHSGTTDSDIRSAKRFFLTQVKKGFLEFEPTGITAIQFYDVNYSIWAEFHNEFGEELCVPWKKKI